MWRGLVVAIVLAGIFAVHPQRPANAAGVVGNGTPGSCTEAALDTALAGGGSVSFNCGPGPVTIPLTSEKIIGADTQINGDGLVTLDGQNQTRIFDVKSSFTLDLTDITLERGNGSGAAQNTAGGAILVESNGVVSITRSTLRNNSGSNGGAIYNSLGSLTITDSTISGNTTTLNGTINVFVGSAIITNSTLSGNTVGNRGGGFYHFGGTFSVSSTTITDNSSSGAEISGAYQSDGSLTFQNTIIANNGILSCFNLNAPTSLGGNLTDDDTTCSNGLNDPTDILASDALLGPLADNGGPTLTHLLQFGSPAIDNGIAAGCPAEDPRGVSRPQGAACDIGAVEVTGGPTYGLCVSYYTGAVTSPLSGTCGAGTVAVEPYNQTFCVNPWTGQLTFSYSGSCTPPRFAHTMPGDGDLLTCVSLYTSANRWVWSHVQCTAYEVANTIPTAP